MAKHKGSISDTAVWIAQLRLQESQRPDRLLDEPCPEFAASTIDYTKLRLMPLGANGGWPIITRTLQIDEQLTTLLNELKSKGSVAVVVLAAGLDSRPYRLQAATGVAWHEFDLPNLVDYKNGIMVESACYPSLQRHGVDISDDVLLRSELRKVSSDVDFTIIVTEGLLQYIEPDFVVRIAKSIRSSGAGWWIIDLLSPGVVRAMNSHIKKNFDAELLFAPRTGVDFFKRLGWEPAVCESSIEAAKRFGRLPYLVSLLPSIGSPSRPGWLRWFGVAVFEAGETSD